MHRIFIVEDHEDMRTMYDAMFRRRKGVEIVGQVVSAEEALKALPEARPDLVIVDISLPGMDGLSLVREMRRTYPDMKSVVVSGHDPARYCAAARDAGADDYIYKDSMIEVRERIARLLPTLPDPV